MCRGPLIAVDHSTVELQGFYQTRLILIWFMIYDVSKSIFLSKHPQRILCKYFVQSFIFSFSIQIRVVCEAESFVWTNLQSSILNKF